MPAFLPPNQPFNNTTTPQPMQAAPLAAALQASNTVQKAKLTTKWLDNNELVRRRRRTLAARERQTQMGGGRSCALR